MRERLISWLKLGAKFAFSFLILAYMVRSGRLDLTKVREGFSHLPYLIGSVALVLTAIGLSLYRWGLLMRGLGIDFSGAQLLRYGMIGNFFNTTMPGAVSGDLIKGWYVLSDHKHQKRAPVLASILLDRVMGVFGLVIVSTSPVILFGSTVWEIPALHKVALGVLMLFAGVVVFFSYIQLSSWGPIAGLRVILGRLHSFKVGRAFLAAYDTLLSYRERPSVLFYALFLSVGTHLCMVGVTFLCAQAMGENHLAPLHYFLLVPIGLLTTAIPIAPAGLGVGQVAFGALFKLGGSTLGADIFTMLVTVQIFFNLCGVFFYLRSPKINAPAAIPVNS